MIQLFQPHTDTQEINGLTQVLDSRWIGKGKRVTEFESAWAQHIGAPAEKVVSTTSCTQALFEAVKLTGLGSGDEVILPTVHFVGAAQAVLRVGAVPVFCDVNEETLNATDATLRAKMTGKTKAIILNHYGGNPCLISRNEYPAELIWIDDLACAPHVMLSLYNRLDFAVWSFDSMKILTTGDGGMLYCRDVSHARQARQDFCLGVNSASGVSSTQTSRWWEFQVETPGQGRYMLNDLAASMGLIQLEKLPRMLAHRQALINQYRHGLQDIHTLKTYDGVYFFWLMTDRRDELATFLREHDIYTSFRYYPLHLAYNTGDRLPNAEWAAARTLNLPLHNNLTILDVNYICGKVKEFYEQ